MKLLYKTSFCCVLTVLSIVLISNGVDAQMQALSTRGNFTSFTPEKTYSDLAKLTALTPLKYRNHPDFGIPVNDSTGWYEEINKRSLKTRTFIGPNNEIIKESAYDNINYMDENGWIRAASTKLKPSLNGWSAKQQETPVYLYKDASTALSLGNNELMVFNKNVRFNQQNISVNNYTVGDNGMYIKDVAPNTDKIIRIGRGTVITDYMIKQPIKLNGDLLISEDIVLPAGYTISDNTEKADEHDVKLVVLDANGKLAAEIRSPRCYDNRHKSSVIGTYHIQKQNGGYNLEIEVPSSWLNDPSLQYPLTIDPIITGPVSIWAGGDIESCFTPNYGSGTIVDTVPADVTITNLVLQGSYYAFTVEGKQVFLNFVTSCNSTGLISNDTDTQDFIIIYTYPPFDDKSLTCCIKPSCSVQTFNLTMEVSRDAGGSGCDSTQYAWYDAALAATDEGSGYTAVFESYVIGRTVFDSTLSVTPNPICGNQCSITENALVYYGVPPYTLRYAAKDSLWTKDTVGFGTRIGCNLDRGTATLKLNIPNCPRPSCKADTTYSVPAPSINDACGNVVGGILPISLPVKSVPDIVVTPATETVCSGTQLALALSSCITGSTYSWSGSDGSGSTDTINNVVNNNGTANITSNYTITATEDGCTGDTTYPVTVTPFTVAITPQNPILCYGSSVALSVTGDANQYSWFTPGDTSVTGLSCLNCANPVANDTVTNNYEVKGTKAGTQCSAYAKVYIGVFPAPTDTLSPTDTLIFAGQPVKLIAHSNGTITWTPSTGLSATTGDTVIATPASTTVYIAIAAIGGDSCLISAASLIKVYTTLLVPSAFTPNSGDENSRFRVLPDANVGITLKTFRVYNRWGQAVFETDNVSDGWDGTYKGKPQPMGTYVYYVEFYKIGHPQLLTEKGNMTLIR